MSAISAVIRPYMRALGSEFWKMRADARFFNRAVGAFGFRRRRALLDTARWGSLHRGCVIFGTTGARNSR